MSDWVKPGLPPWGPHVCFRRVQTLVREGNPLVKAAQFCSGRGLTLTGTYAHSKISAALGASLAAGRADEAPLDVRQANVIVPAVGADFNVVTASMMAAIDQHIAAAAGAHFAEGNFDAAGGHRSCALLTNC
jgi:hypothetical protein